MTWAALWSELKITVDVGSALAIPIINPISLKSRATLTNGLFDS